MNAEMIYEDFADYIMNKVGLEEVVSTKEMDKLRAKGLSVDSFLTHFLANYRILLHGSTVDFEDYLLPDENRGVTCVTNYAPVAILKAVFTNKGQDLHYPGRTSDKFILQIKEVRNKNNPRISDTGFIYVVHSEGFQKGGYEWEFVRKEKTPIIAKLEVLKEDFLYPVYYESGGKNRRIYFNAHQD